jgi:hypothetical protein
MAKFNVGDRVKVVDRRFPSHFGQQGRITSVSATLPAAKSNSLADRLHVPQIGPWYLIAFDKQFEGDHAFYRDSELARI